MSNRLDDLERKLNSVLALNGNAKDLLAWKREAFDDLINADRQQIADLKFELDCLLEKFNDLCTEIIVWQQYTKKLFKWVKQHGTKN